MTSNINIAYGQTFIIYSYLVKNYEFKEMIGMFQILLPKSGAQQNLGT